MNTDEWYMRLALDVARLGGAQTTPNPRVGAVIVRDGVIVGQGAHLKAGGPHAEVHALRMAGEQARGATLYVTLEPCNHHGRTPPCTEGIIKAGIHRVVVATVDHDARTSHQGIERLRDAHVEVTVGVLQDDAKALNRAFFHRIDHGRPWVVYKAAMTLSGHVAADSGQSQFVTGEAAREDVQRLRREHPAIAVGIGTVLADNPRLTIREGQTTLSADAQPVRLVFDSHLRTPVDAHLFSEPGRTIIITGETGSHGTLARIPGVELVTVTKGPHGHIQLGKALSQIADLGLNSILLEGGPTLAGALFDEQLVDEVCIYVAPKMLASGLPVLRGRETKQMNEAAQLTDVQWVPIGQDFRMNARVSYS